MFPLFTESSEQEHGVFCDFHTHLLDEPEYAEALAETARSLGFDRLCIGAGEARYGMVSNEEVLRHAESYPELFVPFACVRLGSEAPAQVETLRRWGFQGLRVSAPPGPYDAAELFGVYEAAAALGMPILFHTGLLPRTDLDGALGLHSEWTRPVYLDTLARRLPGLKIVGTALGCPWYEEAAEMLRCHENVFFDLSGPTVRRRGPGFFRALLGPEDTSALGRRQGPSGWSKIIFGSAARCEDIASVERDHRRLFRALALPEELVGDIMGGNAARLLRLAPGG